MYIAENPIRAFDNIQEAQSLDVVKDMHFTTKSLKEFIDFGKDWGAAKSLSAARRQYEQRRSLREFADREAENRWTEGPS